jgi:hypothetical protein
MKVGILAFGRAGCRIADRIQRFDIRTPHEVTEFVMASDTSAKHLDELTYIDEDETALFGEEKYNGLGTDGVIPEITPIVEEVMGDLKTTITTRRVDDVDAFVVLGSLGGGTGGAGMSVCTDMLRDKLTRTPVYSIGVLPALADADIYTVNAAKTVQSVANASDNLILVDNEKLGLVHPKWNSEMDDDTNPSRVFKNSNEKIARCLHMVLSADEPTPTDKLNGTIAEPREIKQILATGGLSTFGYVSQTLPREARPGAMNRIVEMWNYFKVRMKQMKYERVKQRVENERGTERSEDSENEFSVESPEDMTIGAGDDGDVKEQQDGELVTESDSIDLTSLPKSPFKSTTNSTSTIENIGEKPTTTRDWPHPGKLLPETLDNKSVMINIDPRKCERVLYLFAGTQRLLDAESLITSREWIDKHSDAVKLVKNYPVEHRKVAVLTVNSGIGIPKRIEEMQYIADEIINDDEIRETKSIDSDVKATGRNVFEDTHTLPPAI